MKFIKTITVQSMSPTIQHQTSAGASHFGQPKYSQNGSLANDTIYNGSGKVTIRTRISANQALSLLAIVVSQYGDEDSTASEVLLLRTGYSGNHLSQVKIAQSGTFFNLIPTLSVSSDGYIQIEGQGGNFSIKFISTGRLN